MPPASRLLHRHLAANLRQARVDCIFGLVGDANLFMVKSFIEDQGSRYVAPKHEANAVLAAIGQAQARGKVSVASITHGPGLTNAVTARIEGVRAGVPVVIMAGDTPPGGPQHQQNIDQREIVAATGAGFVELRRPETAVEDLERAFRLALHQRRPIVFNMRAAPRVRVDGAEHLLAGDNARRDSDGYSFYEGLADDVINSSGYRIGPQEVENALVERPAVGEAAVIASPDAQRGEIVKAFIVLHDDRAASETLGQELQDFVKRLAAPCKYPCRIEFVADLPQSAIGKIQRRVLRNHEFDRNATV